MKRNIQEARDDEFSFNRLKIMNFKNRLSYCRQHLGEPIGTGSSRMVFQLNDEWVLKLALNKAGAAQNEVEVPDGYMDKMGLFPKVDEKLSDMEDFYFLVSEFVLPLSDEDCKECTGLELYQLLNFISQSASQYSKYGGHESWSWDDFENLMDSNDTLRDLNDYLTNYQNEGWQDLDQRNLGMALRNGKPSLVILDSGFNEDVMDKFYRGQDTLDSFKPENDENEMNDTTLVVNQKLGFYLDGGNLYDRKGNLVNDRGYADTFGQCGRYTFLVTYNGNIDILDITRLVETTSGNYQSYRKVCSTDGGYIRGICRVGKYPYLAVVDNHKELLFGDESNILYSTEEYSQKDHAMIRLFIMTDVDDNGLKVKEIRGTNVLDVQPCDVDGYRPEYNCHENKENIHNILTESIYNQLLIEAKSPEEIQKILVQKYDGILPSFVIANVMRIDPTKKYSYTQWALKAIANGEDKYNVNYLVLDKLFNFAKEHNDFQLQTFNSINDAYDGLEWFEGKSQYDIVYEDNEWIIYVPQTYAAERYIVHHLYNGASWCTASSSGEYYFKQYTQNRDKLYILANKEDNSIYQYSPQTGEFNDKYNEQVNSPSDLVGANVYKWFSDQDMDINDGVLPAFPGPHDIYRFGETYGLKCLDYAERKYQLCDNQGQDVNCNTIFWHPISFYENQNVVYLISKPEKTEKTYIFNKKSLELLVCFDSKYDTPHFSTESVWGMSDGYFYDVNLVDGIVDTKFDGYDEWKDYGGYAILHQNGYNGNYVIYYPLLNIICTDKEGNEVEFKYPPDFNRNNSEFYGENADGIKIKYNTHTNEIHREVETANSMAEGIKTQFNTLLEKISKNYNPDKILD